MTWYRESGVLRRLKAISLHPKAILAALVITIFLINILGMALLIIAAKVIFALQFTDHPFDVLAAFILGSLSFFSLGFVLAGLLPLAVSQKKYFSLTAKLYSDLRLLQWTRKSKASLGLDRFLL
jgi:hypothetical protein